MKNQQQLWLPDNYGKGTIIYDNSGKPYEAIKKLDIGVNIWEIEEVEKDYAKKAIKNGADIRLFYLNL